MIVYHHTLIDDTEHSWPIDTQAAAAVMPWIARRPEVLAKDLAGMAGLFPPLASGGGR